MMASPGHCNDQAADAAVTAESLNLMSSKKTDSLQRNTVLTEQKLYTDKYRLKLPKEIYDELVQDTTLDQSILDGLISRCVFTIHDREEIMRQLTPMGKNKLFLDILEDRPYNGVGILRECFTEDMVYQQLVAKMSKFDKRNIVVPVISSVEPVISSVESVISSVEPVISSHLSGVPHHCVRLQKNYKALVDNLQSTEEITDFLYQKEILNGEEKDEITLAGLTKYESIRRLLQKMIHKKDKDVFDQFIVALREDPCNEYLVKNIKDTEVTEQDKNWIYIAQQDLKRRQKFMTANTYIEDLTATEGDPAEFRCELIEHTSNVQWYFEGKPLNHSDKYVIRDRGNNHILIIKNVTLSDKGEYSVKTKDIIRKAVLHVEAYFRLDLADVKVVEGDDAKFCCELIEQCSNIQWYKGEQPLGQSDKYSIQDVDRKHMLTISKVVLEDKGEYTIRTNRCSRKAVLDVEAYFKDDLEDVKVTEGDTAEFCCELIKQSSDVLWYRKEHLLKPSDKYSLHISNTKYVLIIHNVNLDDEGEYSVTAKHCIRKAVLKVEVKLPLAIQQMNPEDKEKFLDLLQSESVIRHIIRVLIIGENGVGKTSLLRRLLRENIDDVKSTDGIDIVRRCKIRLRDGEWIVMKESDTRKELIEQLRRAIRQKSNDVEQKVTEADVIESPMGTQSEREEKPILKVSTRKVISDILKPTSSQKGAIAGSKELLTGSDQNADKQTQSVPKRDTRARKADKRTQRFQNKGTITWSARSADTKPQSVKNEDTRTRNGQEAESNKYDFDRTSVLETDSEYTGLEDDIDNKIAAALDELLSDVHRSVNDEVSTDIFAECRIMDFAGQKEYYATHQVFLSPDVLYLLVSDINKDIKSVTEQGLGFDEIPGYVDFWFDNIHLYARKDDSEDQLNPPVVVVGTKTDKCQPELRRRKEIYNNQLLGTIREEEKRKHLRDILFISNTEPSPEDFDKLRKAIFSLGTQIKTFEERIPLKWIQFERSLDVMREIGKNILTFSDVSDLASRSFISDEDEIELFLLYQHSIGNIVYFESLKDYVILSQKWLADAFKCLVCDSHKVDIRLRNWDAWQALETRGELSMSLVSGLFEKEAYLKFSEFQDHLLNVMELFGIISKPKTIRDNKTIEKVSKYYMPSMIKDAPEFSTLLERFGADLDSCRRQPWVCLKFEFLPLSIFNHILFYFMKNHAVCEKYDSNNTKTLALYHGTGVFYFDSSRDQKIALCFAKNAICIQFWEWDQPKKGTYRNLLTEIQSEILRLKQKYNIKTQYSILGKCADGNIHCSDGWISHEKLKEAGDKYFCEDHNERHQSKALYDTWFMDDEEAKLDELPYEVSNLQKMSASEYCNLIREESYERFEIQTMLVGVQKAGKTTIARYLAGKGPPRFGVPTDAIVQYRTFIDMDNHDWLAGRQDFTLDEITVSRSLQNILQQPMPESTTVIVKPSLIKKMKNIFGVTKDVDQIRMSITKERFLEKSIEVDKKGLHKRKLAPVIIWDFVGDDLFYSTHQTFLKSRALYIVVVDGSRNLDEPCPFEQYLPGKSGIKTSRDYIRFWIITIVTYCKGAGHGFPKIMVVLTHKDRVDKEYIEQRRRKLFGEIKEMFSGTPLIEHLVFEDQIFVNARDKEDTEMAAIKKIIIRHAKTQPTWGQKTPKCFIPLELEFSSLARKGINVITMEQMKKINSEQPIRPLTDPELKVFLKFQHATGKILYFDETNLDSHIMLSPKHLIDAFQSIVTDKRFLGTDRKRQEAWEIMEKKGVINKNVIDEIWRKKYTKFYVNKDYLIGVMTHLDILVEPRRYDRCHQGIAANFYYIDSMLRTEDKTGYLQSQTFSQRNIALAFYPSSVIVPPALCFSFISYCLSIWGVKQYGDDNDDMLFHRSAVFTVDSSVDMHVQCEDEYFIIRLVHCRNRTLIIRDLASSVRECLVSALEKISQLYIKTSSETCDIDEGSFQLSFCCGASEKPCFLSQEEIQTIHDIWICPKHQIEHGKDLLTCWFSSKELIACEEHCPVTDKEFLQQTPTDLHLRRLALEYDDIEVRELATHLKLPYSVWENQTRNDLDRVETHRFEVLRQCRERYAVTFFDIKEATEKGNIRTPHTICKVVRDHPIGFDQSPEKWDLYPTDKDIDNLAPLVGGDSLHFLLELGMDFDIWEKITCKRTMSDIVKLNRDILKEWKENFCKSHSIRPSLRHIAQAFNNLGKNIKVVENALFS